MLQQIQFDDLFLISSCILSVLGTSYVILNYLIKPELRDSGFKLIYHLNVANFIWTATILLNVLMALTFPLIMEHQQLCQSFASIKLFSHHSGLLWNASITYTLYKGIFSDEQDEEEKLKKGFMKQYLICYLFPVICSLGLWISGDYGHVYPYYDENCFVGDDLPNPDQWLRNLIMRVIFDYVPVWGVFIFITFAIFRVMFYLYSHFQDTEDKSFIYKLVLFPIMILICQIPSTVKRLLVDLHENVPQAMPYIDLSLITLNGFLNALVYSYHTLLKERSLKDICQSCCCCLCFQAIRSGIKEPSFIVFDDDQNQMQSTQTVNQQMYGQQLQHRASNYSQQLQEIELIGSNGIFRQSECNKSVIIKNIENNIPQRL